MSKPKVINDRNFEVTPSMRRFIDYFSDLGPRWGLSADTCKVHALLYLAAQPLSPDAIAKHAELTKNRSAAAIKDLLGWRVATEKEAGISIVGGEPIVLMFSALEEREISPALTILHTCKKEASEELHAGSKSSEKISAMLQLVKDLTALEKQFRPLYDQTVFQARESWRSRCKAFRPCVPQNQKGWISWPKLKTLTR